MEPDPATKLEADIDLLLRIGRGDQQSFEQFYDQFSGILFSIAFQVLHNKEAAEDVLQEAFIQIWEKAPLYNPSRGKPFTWAAILTRNRAIDRLRSLQRRSRLQDDAETELQTMDQPGVRDPLATVTTLENAKLVHEAILSLATDQREVIELAFLSSMSHHEIAEHLKLPLGTVKARIRRGLMKLKEMIEPQL